MAVMTIVKSRTTTFEKWKRGWDAGAAARAASGATQITASRDPKDPDTVYVVGLWPSAEVVGAYMAASKERVFAETVGAPEVNLLDVF